MNSTLESLLFGFALLALVAGILFTLHWLRADDAAAGIRLGQISPEEDSLQHQPGGAHSRKLAQLASTTSPGHHFIVVCSYCHGIYKITDEHGVLVAQVGDTLKVSHGICPACEPRVQAELDRTLPALAHA